MKCENPIRSLIRLPFLSSYSRIHTQTYISHKICNRTTWKQIYIDLTWKRNADYNSVDFFSHLIEFGVVNFLCSFHCYSANEILKCRVNIAKCMRAMFCNKLRLKIDDKIFTIFIVYSPYYTTKVDILLHKTICSVRKLNDIGIPRFILRICNVIMKIVARVCNLLEIFS